MKRMTEKSICGDVITKSLTRPLMLYIGIEKCQGNVHYIMVKYTLHL